MIAALQDGHGNVYYNPVWNDMGWLPVRADWIENQVVVTTSGNVLVEPGDVIVSVDGVPAAEILADQEQYISGSSQWKRYRALTQFGMGDYGSAATVMIDRGGSQLHLQLNRGGSYAPEEPRPEMIEEITPGVYYVDLSRAPMADIAAVIDELAAADGVIFDLRGYPNGNDAVLHHLTDETILSARWNIPLIIYPDHENIAGWNTSGRWVIEPRAPRLSGHVVFLTEGRAISYAESVMGIVEAYQLGDIVGRPTAGANGNVNPLDLVGDFTVYWTGMKVLKHDGSQHHLIGIQPTHPVQRTIAGVRAGIDEDLEAALDLIRD
jgi:C-terminal processing protease CtpA/Prc